MKRRESHLSYEEAIAKVKRLWGRQAREWGEDWGIHWVDLARVQARINRKITGLDGVERYHYFVYYDLNGRVPVERALTLGCGPGELERGMSQYDFARRHDAIDLSEAALERARAAAEKEGHSHIRYEPGDLNRIELPADTFDVIFGISSIHHVAELESLYENVFRALRPGGWFYMDEFVGPSQYQWPDAQLEAINTMLARIPPHLRASRTQPTKIRERVERPTIEEMNAADPSEAIRSAEIIPLVYRYFPQVEVRRYGGTLLQMLLADIAGNFDDDDPEAVRWLEETFDFEDRLLDSGRLGNDFAVILARKP